MAGVTPASPLEDFARFQDWRANGNAGEMTYLTDYRGDLRADPRNLLATAKTVVCVGKLYNTDQPTTIRDPERGWISRYASAPDYHVIVRAGLEQLARRIADINDGPFEWRACVDTAPLLERSYAHAAGLGWIGKNTCLINQQQGSWFFLGELLLSISLAPDEPAPARCGSCTRCIDACPTVAIVPTAAGGWTVDARRCISYLTIEKRGELSSDDADQLTNHVFGCDICQDVCPWNRRAPVSTDAAFATTPVGPQLGELAGLSAEEFRTLFRHTPVWRAKYQGFLRNVALAMGNSGVPNLLLPLEKMALHPDPLVASSALSSLRKLRERIER